MPLRNYDADTYVAFMDISGFKVLMNNEQRAIKALDVLYNKGYFSLLNHTEVQGLFISDSGILIAEDIPDKVESLRSLLVVIREINQEMMEHGFMLTTSIAYGRFSYQERIEFHGIEKNSIYGNGYVSAYLNNENGNPKIQPGQCRIVKRNCPVNLEEIHIGNHESLSLVQERNTDNDHYYFYWMLNEPTEIDGFESVYQDAYNLKFAGMLEALRQRY